MRLRIVAGLTAVAGLAACEEHATSPGSLAVTWRLELTGPSQVAPGETAQFQLFAINGGGAARRDVTSEASWQSSKSSVATVAGGLVRGVSMGDVTIIARFELLSQTQSMTILTRGTYRVTGTVREQGLGVPLSNAKVQADGEGGNLLETSTASDGRFTLYGVPAIGDVRVTKPGYVPLVQRLQLQASTNIDLTLQPAMPRPDLTGTYRLTITAAECKAGFPPLPADLMQRSYTAAVTQTADQLDVALSGADLIPASNAVARFPGTAEVLGASFRIAAGDFYYTRTQPDLVEKVSDGNVLTISGNATTTLSGRTLSGLLQGSMVESAGIFGRTISQCVSNTMPFVMTRQ